MSPQGQQCPPKPLTWPVSYFPCCFGASNTPTVSSTLPSGRFLGAQRQLGGFAGAAAAPSPGGHCSPPCVHLGHPTRAPPCTEQPSPCPALHPLPVFPLPIALDTLTQLSLQPNPLLSHMSTLTAPSSFTVFPQRLNRPQLSSPSNTPSPPVPPHPTPHRPHRDERCRLGGSSNGGSAATAPPVPRALRWRAGGGSQSGGGPRARARPSAAATYRRAAPPDIPPPAAHSAPRRPPRPPAAGAAPPRPAVSMVPLAAPPGRPGNAGRAQHGVVGAGRAAVAAGGAGRRVGGAARRAEG